MKNIICNISKITVQKEHIHKTQKKHFLRKRLTESTILDPMTKKGGTKWDLKVKIEAVTI